MTFIQTLLTPEFVILVSDRRLSAQGGIYDDSYNKAVSWCGMIAVGFTGAFAHVDYRLQQPVTHWIAGILASESVLKDGLDSLEDGMRSLTAKLSQWRRFSDRRLTIVLTGIAPDYGTAFFRALSNFENGYEIFPTHSDTHVYRWGYEVPLHGTEVHYFTAGAYLGGHLKRRAEGSKLARIAEKGGINNAARYMIKLQRQVAEQERRRGTNSVGEDSMVVSVPANVRRDQMMTLMSSTETDAIHAGSPYFSFVKAGSFSKDRFAPILACDDRIAVISAWGEGDNQRINFQQIDPPKL